MATFANNVFEAFQRLRSEYGFVPARAAGGERFASLVRQVTEDVFSYVFVHDGRPSDENLDVDFWVAPPETPDHSLEKLYVGYKIRIGSEYEIDDAFFIGCEKRIIHLLPCVATFCPLVRSELMNPGIRTKRWSVYQMERQILSYFISKAIAGDSLAMAVQKKVDISIHASSVESIEKLCWPIASAILEERRLDENVLKFYEGRVESLASALANQLYVRALGAASASHS